MSMAFIAFLVFAILIAVFTIQNSNTVIVSFLFAKFSISQALVILVSIISGAVIVMLLGSIKQVKLNKKVKDSLKTISKLEQENQKLKSDLEKLNQNSIIESAIADIKDNDIKD
ncbi:LapA family protein [Clostridium sp. JNZ J1-5]|nr:lipopolysaccharide assembly protein LapA domain-containing protein [Clostridium sp.]